MVACPRYLCPFPDLTHVRCTIFRNYLNAFKNSLPNTLSPLRRKHFTSPAII